MRCVRHAKPVSQAGAAGGNLNQFPNFCKECDRRVRFEDRERSRNSSATAKQQQDMVSDKSRPSRPADVANVTVKQTGELPPFGEKEAHLQQPQQRGLGTAHHQGQEFRLRGKLKWLFEQDRMFWESNSAKSSRRGSPERDHSRGLNAVSAAKPAGDYSSNDKLVLVVEESSKKVAGSKELSVSGSKPPRQPNDKLKVSRRENSPKVPWTFSNSTAKFWPRGKSKAQNTKTTPAVEEKSLVPVEGQDPVEHNARCKSNDSVMLMSSLDLGGEGMLSDSEDGPKSGESSESVSSDEEEEEMRRKVDVVIARGGPGSLKDVKNQAAYLKAKCNLLSKEKDDALRKWKKGCLEIDEAAKMAQALRTAIETLLEAGASGSRADFKARQDILESQTQALKMRMEKLRRKNSEGLLKDSEVRRPDKTLEDRIETLKKTSEGRSLASPEIPRDTEHKVEALRARLEKLMVATNSRVTDEQGKVRRRSREQKKPVEDPSHHKTHPDEKGELKMRGWYNSLSAELTAENSPGTSRGVCEKCNGAHGGFIFRETNSSGTPSTSKQATPSTSKQVSPWHSAHERERDGPGSAPSSEETKKNVIHKIAEEVRLEAEQWFQVQELLGRVGEDMKSLQEACSTWERRAILAEAQVVALQREEQERKEKTIQLSDEKIAELQKEMLRLRETVEGVKKQLVNMNIDPSRWFEAAHNFGYAFMPVNLHLPDTSCSCKGKCNYSSCDRGTPDSSDQWRQKGGTTGTGNTRPSSSANSSTAPSTISSSGKTPPENEVRQRSQFPSQQWANEIARAEEEEILTNATAIGRFSKLEFANSAKETFPSSGGKLQEKTSKLFHKEHGLESSGSRGEMLLQLQSSTRERCNTLHQEEQLSRYNFNSSARRSPLRDVLENIVSSKENKRPF